MWEMWCVVISEDQIILFILKMVPITKMPNEMIFRYGCFIQFKQASKNPSIMRILKRILIRSSVRAST